MRLRGPCLVVLAGLFTQAAMAAETVPLPQPRPETSAPDKSAPDAAKPDAGTPDTGKLDTAAPDAGAPDPSRFGGGHIDKPIQNTLPQPATMTPPSADTVNPDRFGAKQPDAAYGAFQRGLYKTAYNLALDRAKNGDPAAETLVAEILSRGLGVPVNPAEAGKWYALAAEQGVPEAQFQYALMLLDGRYVKKDEKGAFALMQASAEAGNRLAQFNFAQLLVQQDPGDGGLAKAAVYYERAAATGLADAQYAMAQLYANGAGGKPHDDAQARMLLAQAARQNYDTAQIDLATWMIEGRGGARDLKSGFAWMKRAAQGGNVAAQNRLAKLYMGGIGTDPDLILAGAWYIVARRAGLIDPRMDDFLQGLDDGQTKQALQKANRLP
ncbi:tetratricopeptide repeat protein [Mesorhizobium sp. VK25A]|uniref:Tetratricopeptide repeat protein n=1 Tax=Mesorhizobium vachelliae TaxID=3072309 RepID=A0ABU5A1P4_9HYPH|nr:MULTISPECIES: tetratricopeptide repeat protein [unclassified Mesorhizobium]MDX8531578.1 tetratricopeptide repeat protein [Mesorhizobium sp. VK25D]MDX8543980.1 tetratricopeptide repeat protein [Mesorhizobium sp. VK25A]